MSYRRRTWILPGTQHAHNLWAENAAEFINCYSAERTMMVWLISVNLVLILSSFIINVRHVSAESPFLFTKNSWWGRYRGGASISNSNNAFVSHANNNNNNNKTEPETTTTNDARGTNISDPSPNNNSTVETNNNTNNIPAWKLGLPPPLCNKTKTLQRIVIPYNNNNNNNNNNDKATIEIYLLGTAHVSNDSSRDVELLLDSLCPDAIFVELCDSRIAMMEDLPQQNQSQPFWERVEEVRQQDMSRMQALSTVLLTQVQEEYADSLGVELGGEFRVAFRYWRSYYLDDDRSNNGPLHHPHLVLGDRPVAITLARAWESLGLWGKTKVMFGLILSCFQKPNPEELRKWIQSILVEESDVLTSSIADLRRHFPSLEKVIIQERDAYMACKLHQTCRAMISQSSSSARVAASTNRPPQKIVIAAIVGAGHVPGICQWLVNGGTTNDTQKRTPEEILGDLVTSRKYRDQVVSSLVEEVTVVSADDVLRGHRR